MLSGTIVSFEMGTCMSWLNLALNHLNVTNDL